MRRLPREIVGWQPLRPHRAITPEVLERGLRALLLDGVCSQVQTALVTGAFMVALALALGAPNFVIGLLAAAPPLAQILQLPAVVLVDRVSLRKALTVYSALTSRLVLLALAALPWMALTPARVAVLVATLAAHHGLSAVGNCAFNPWMRDLLPAPQRSGYLGKRLAIATAASAAASLAAALSVTGYVVRGGQPVAGYAAILVAGGLVGLLGVLFLSRVPEPIQRPIRRRPLADILVVPLRDANFRALLAFLGLWNFAATMSNPFFAVYELRVIGLSLGAVVILALVTQGTNVVFFRAWGRLADRFGNRRVLQLSGPLFIASLVLWPFTVMPHLEHLRWPLLVTIHGLVGMSTAGVTLCSSAVALKSAPPGQATAYLATNALVSGAAAIVAPLVAGLTADLLATQRITVTLEWTSTLDIPRHWALPALALQGLDFLFLGAFLIGAYALHRLLLVREEGEAAHRIAMRHVYGEVLKVLGEISSVPGLRQLTTFPYGVLRLIRDRRRRERPPLGERRRRTDPAPAG